MDNINTSPNSSEQQQSRNISYPDQIRNEVKDIVSTIKMIMEIAKSISTLRRVFRGEALMQSDDGSTEWVQVVKPMFIKLNPVTREPLTNTIIINGVEKKSYIPNDEAIEEILSQLYFMGMNQITPLTNLSEDTVLDDLKEYECKLAGVLMLKQVSWGLDKALMPMIMTKMRCIIEDARYMCVNGTTMRSLSQQVSRIEQIIESTDGQKKGVYK